MGQDFIEFILSKISALRKMIDERGLDIDIQVDGGIKIDNVKKIVKAGADIIVAGSAIFNSGDVKRAVEQFKASVASV